MLEPDSQQRCDEDVLRIADSGWIALETLFNPAGLDIVRVPNAQEIPGSHWGDEEAGLIQHSLYARLDTPVHSVLHEASHWILMSVERRAALHTDAKGSAVEEMAVCYLQVLLADKLDFMGRKRMFTDMDRWGYSFRHGSTEAWFNQDADDALRYLAEKLPHAHGIPGLHVNTP